MTYNELIKSNTAEFINMLENEEVENTLSKLKLAVMDTNKIIISDKIKASSAFLIYILKNKLENEKIMYCSFDTDHQKLILPLNKNSDWTNVKKLYKKIVFSHNIPSSKINEVFLNHYDDNITIQEIWLRYNKEVSCVICNNIIPYEKFYRPNNRKVCSNECYSKLKSNRMTNGQNPRDLLSKDKWDIIHQKQSVAMKQKILEGKWTPCVTNSWCKSRVIVDSIPFRSSWEAYFYIYKTYIDNKIIEFEKLRVPYFSSTKNKNRIYIVDFIDHKNKIAYEIKPDSAKDDTTVQEKEQALKLWCINNNYIFKFISNTWFQKYYYSDIVLDNVSNKNTALSIIKRLEQFNKNTTKINSISDYTYTGDTYNLHIEGNHNYFAENMCVSNCHGLKLDNVSTDIVYNSINAKYKIGLTGTLPDDPIAKMAVMSCVGAPKRYIRTQGLIERGLATPVHINVLKLRYSNEDKALFKYVGNYTKKLKFIKEHPNRNMFIGKLSLKVSEIGNTVVMCSHTEHMKDVFIEIMKQKYSEVQVKNKNIVGAKAFDFQEQYNIFYIAGATKPKDRQKIINILKNHDGAILISNYALLSTGLSIKRLKNIIFASPMKSYTTITQSIGRAIRLHISKNQAEIYDLVDDFSTRGDSGPFYNQYQERLIKSYQPEGFPIDQRTILL